ncbi:sulfatase [Halorussus litoreus]|uniref:sulfatase n=1 Tax=Halorussus litoreus TaxID=1710536 RepID=UPI0018E5552F|nr:sulfatase [Halorussus litoreus]
MANNIVYVTIDSIRADRTGVSGYDRPTTPNLDELARDGTVWTRAVASGIPTYYSFKSLLGGVPALSHSRDVGIPPETTTLAEAFRRLGYETAGFNAGNPWLTPEHGYDRGVETFRDFLTDDDGSTQGGLDELIRRAQSLLDGTAVLEDKLGWLARTTFAVTDRTPLEPAETVTDHAIRWLAGRESSDRPFFLWIHYMDPHYPWVPRDEDLRRVGASAVSDFEKGRLWHAVAHHDSSTENATDGAPSISSSALSTIEDLYDAEVRRTDEAVGRLVGALRSMDAFDDTLLAVVGDHGTELGDHGGFSHGPRTLYDEVTRVPLVVSGPGVATAERDATTSLVGVPRTLLDRSGAEPSRSLLESFCGTDAFAADDEPVVSEVVYDFDPATGANLDNDLLVACYDWPWKLVQNRELGTHELYDLDADPDERVDRSEAEPRKVDDLREAIAVHRDRIERRNRTIAERRRVRRRLAELERAGAI